MLTNYKEVIAEHFDMTNRRNRKILLNLDEADQSSVLLSLTSKLYSMIVDKIDDIDYGEIPETKGDITLLTQYNKMNDCIDTLTKILQKYRQPTDCIDTIQAAMDNIENDRDLYKRGFATKVEIIMTTYNSIVLAIIASLSYMITVTVEFIKDGNGGFKATFDKAGIARTKDSLTYSNLVHFNDACSKGQIRNAFEPLIKSKARNLAVTTLGAISVGIAVAGILMNILPIIRELVYFFYAGRVRISQYFDVQADLLEMNSQMLKSHDVEATEDENKHVARRQESIADAFRKIANFFAVKTKEADRHATNEIKRDNKDMDVDDVVDTIPDSAGSNDSLF